MAGARLTGERIEWSDALDLEMLHLREACGLSCAEVGRRLGLTKGAVIGRLRRLGEAAAPGGAGDGTMEPGWWRSGMARRASESAESAGGLPGPVLGAGAKEGPRPRVARARVSDAWPFRGHRTVAELGG